MTENEKVKIEVETSVKQKILEDELKKSLNKIKEFVKGAGKELSGLDQALADAAGDPVAIGKLVVDTAKKAVNTLNEMAVIYREQQQAVIDLQDAAKNNPYLSDRNIKQLNRFACEIQRITGLDITMITQAETKLAILGRNQEQIQQIIKVAAYMAAGGVTNFDEAVNDLNNSLNGTVSIYSKLYPELKALSEEALASGEAIKTIGQKLAVNMDEIKKNGFGDLQAIKNTAIILKDTAVEIGGVWETISKPFKRLITLVKETFNEQEEQSSQDKIAEIRKESLVDAINFEAEYRQQQIQIEYENQLDEANQSISLRKETLERIMEAELEAAGDNAVLKQEIEEKFNEDVAQLDDEAFKKRQELETVFLEQKEQAEKDTISAIEQAEKDMISAIEQAEMESMQNRLGKAQDYLNSTGFIANGIAAIWKNSIDYQLNEDLKKNDALDQSDEERAAKEKEIRTKSAQEKYKADLFQWSNNMIMAIGQGAMAIMNALTTVQPWPAAIAAAVVAGAMSTIQQATIMSARPQAPSFHTGGIVEGIGEQKAVLMGGEVVQTQRQFQNTMQAISNLADGKTGGGVQMNVKVENNASGLVSATPQITEDGLIVVVEQIVQNSFASGKMDRSVALQQSNLRGKSLT